MRSAESRMGGHRASDVMHDSLEQPDQRPGSFHSNLNQNTQNPCGWPSKITSYRHCCNICWKDLLGTRTAVRLPTTVVSHAQPNRFLAGLRARRAAMSAGELVAAGTCQRKHGKGRSDRCSRDGITLAGEAVTGGGQTVRCA